MRKLALALFIGFVGTTTAAAQDRLSAARDLYASAEYDQALAALSDLESAVTETTAREQIEQYRAFCLFALGRTADAQAVAESLTRSNPTRQLDTGDTSPRLIAMFAEVRRRLLPELIRERYRRARVALDADDLSAAEPPLLVVRQLLDDAEQIGIADEGLADLDLLVDGFLHLVRTTTSAREAPPAPEPVAAAPAAAPAIDQGRVLAVTAPVAIVQEVPPVPSRLMAMFRDGRTSGMLDVTIDERGNVERSTMRQSIHPLYDQLVIRATRQWKYRPAVDGGVPIRYVKSIEIVLNK